MSPAPRVWSDNVATLAVSPDGFSLWVGRHRVEFVKSIAVTCRDTEDGRSAVEVVLTFHHSWDPEVSPRIEENVRLARTVPWVTVVT